MELSYREEVAVHLIDVSIEDDSLLPSPRPSSSSSSEVVQQEHISHEMTKMSATCDTICEGDNTLRSNSKAEAQNQNSFCTDEKVLLCNKKEKKRAHVNLRKSLAWNTAFFTEEGVLDQEELFLVNETLKKTSQPASDFPKKIAQENSLRFSQPQSNPSTNAGSHTIMSGTIREYSVPDIIVKSSSKLEEDVDYFKEASLKVEGGLMNHTHLTRSSFSSGAQETNVVTLLVGHGNCNQRETTRNEGIITSTHGRNSPEYWGGTSDTLSSIPESPRETFNCADLSRRSSFHVEIASLPQMTMTHSMVHSDNNEAIDDAKVVTEGKYRSQDFAIPSRGGGCGELVKPSGLKRPSPKLGFFDLAKTKEREAKLGYKSGVGSTSEEKKNVDLQSRIPLPPHLRDVKKRKSDTTTDSGQSKKPTFLSNQSNTGCDEEGLGNKSDFPAFRLLPVNTNNSFSLPDKSSQQRNALDMNLSKENLSSKNTAEQENICFEDLLKV